MNRNRLFLLVAVILGLANLAYYVWQGWGLITIHAEDQALSRVLQTIEKQGHVSIKSSLDPAMKVRLDLVKVPLVEALESLCAVTDSRWRLTYLIGEPGPVRGALGTIGVGDKLEGWKTLHYPLPPMGDDEGSLISDPRDDVWTVHPPEDPKLQAYLEGAARSVSAAFCFPENWNPQVSQAPKSGPIGKVADALAKSIKGQAIELIILRGGGREGGERPERAAGEPRGEGFNREGGGFNREAMEQRMLSEIEKLPPEKQAAAKAEFEERKAFFSGMKDLEPDARRAKMEEFFERPDVQERMEKLRTEKDARRTPEQRLSKAQSYRERKQQALSGAKK